jgi:uncharacterized protein (TIGR03083 family)
VSLFESLTDFERESLVPCLPGWSVRDVLSHVAGVANDVVSGDSTAAATDEWTAAQVDRWRESDTAELIDQWSGQVTAVGEVVAAARNPRPSIDCHMHEHDVRHAVGQVGDRDTELIALVAQGASRIQAGRPLRIVLADGSPIESDGDGLSIALENVSMFEVARSRLGRRSLKQFLTYDWSDPPSELLISSWFHFGPSEIDINE